MKRLSLILVVAATIAGSLMLVATGADAACGDVGGAVVAGVCTVPAGTHNVAANQTIAITEPLLLQTGAIIKVSPGASPLVLNVNGDFTMQAGSLIDGTIIGGGQGADITINVDGNARLIGGAPGAQIVSDQKGSCNVATTRGGNLTLIATGNVTTEDGSRIQTVSGCGRGEIIIKGVILTLEGVALSEGNTTKGRGGPVTAVASCDLTVGPTGQLISRGRDPGADLVHVEGGCVVKINGLVASLGPGHIGGTNRCQPNLPNPGDHIDKPVNSQACVEIWAGNELLIDSVPPNNGQVASDTGTSGGASGTSWIDLFSRGPITINGDSTTPFSVHANQSVSNGKGGTVTVKSTTSSVSVAGLAVQASVTSVGGDGGTITVQGNTNVNQFILTRGGELEARGTTGSNGVGGTVNVKSFNGAIAAIAGPPASLIDVRGQVPGSANLEACTQPIQFPPGVVDPAASLNANPVAVCGGAPTVPAYVTLPACVCQVEGCPCVSSFNFVQGSSPETVRLVGTQLQAVTGVQLSTGTCNPGTVGETFPVPITGQTGGEILVNVSSVNPGPYKVITISALGSCCSAGTVNVP
jgi:hypothetical protein